MEIWIKKKKIRSRKSESIQVNSSVRRRRIEILNDLTNKMLFVYYLIFIVISNML
jgi:hypothetical protein